MDSTQTKLLTIFAPAKINLYLHVTGQLDNGYHTLDSLVTFSDTGDTITIAPAGDFQFEIKGSRAGAFALKEKDASPDSANLVVQAAWTLSRAAQKNLNARITLTKELPQAAGLGGGSSDAAAALWGLCEWWGIPRNAPYLPGLMARLGADIPVCFSCRPARIRGIGDILDPAPAMPEIAAVLVNPGVPCLTGEVFKRYAGAFREPRPLPGGLDTFQGLISFLSGQENDLEAPAQEIVPQIGQALAALRGQKGCALARMSGSGASCFGLFETETQAQASVKKISGENPAWWVKQVWLNRPERY